MILYAEGPYTRLDEDSRLIRVETDVPRLLAWGREPVASNSRNYDMVMEAVRSASRKSKWYGMPFKRFHKMTGWPEGLATAQQFAMELPSFTVKSIKRRLAWDADGDEFDRDRFDAGYDEAWRVRKRVERPSQPVLRLTCSIGGSCGHRAEDLIWAGAAAFAVCDAAEAAGYRMEVQATFAVNSGFTTDDRHYCAVIRIKEAGEPLDRETAVMALACPAFFRWHCIRSMNAISDSLVPTAGYGMSEETPSSCQGDLHLPHCYTQSDAMSHVRALVARIEGMAQAA